MVDFVGRVADGADHLGGYRNWVRRVGCPWYANRVQHGGRYHGLYRRTGPAGRRQPPEIGPAAGQRGEDGRQSQADHAPPARLLMSHPAGQDGPRDGARAAAADPRAQTAAPTGGRTGADSGAPAAAGGRTGSPGGNPSKNQNGSRSSRRNPIRNSRPEPDPPSSGTTAAAPWTARVAGGRRLSRELQADRPGDPVDGGGRCVVWKRGPGLGQALLFDRRYQLDGSKYWYWQVIGS